jgi:hypothetical protein
MGRPRNTDGRLRPYQPGTLRSVAKPIPKGTPTKKLCAVVTAEESLSVKLYALAHGLTVDQVVRTALSRYVPSLVVHHADDPAATRLHQVDADQTIDDPIPDAA